MKFHLDTFSSTEVSGWLLSDMISEMDPPELSVEVEGCELARFTANAPTS